MDNGKKLLPAGDKTPADWLLPRTSTVEQLKKLLRRVLYPSYLKLIQPFLKRHYDSGDLGVDHWYWGHRGHEQELMRMRLDQVHSIRGSSVLVAGCGTGGREIPTWLDYQPSRVVGIDYFNYQRAWESLIREHGHTTEISFVQDDLGELESVEDETFDIVASDAVLEHLQDLPGVLREFYRILKPGGALYASFGPLWYCWGGDHVSGYDSIASGYNHLLLEQEAYERYLEGAGEFSHSEHDGRTWIKHDLFSYLRPREYLTLLSGVGFEKVYLGFVLEPRAIRCLRENPQLQAKLMAGNGKLDLILSGMTIIYRKRGL